MRKLFEKPGVMGEQVVIDAVVFLFRVLLILAVAVLVLGGILIWKLVT